MSESEMLRQVAAQLRKEAQVIETEKMIKCGQALMAAQALSRLREKVRAHVR